MLVGPETRFRHFPAKILLDLGVDPQKPAPPAPEFLLYKFRTYHAPFDKSGVAYRNLTRYETGKMKPYGVNRAKLAAALGVKPEEL